MHSDAGFAPHSEREIMCLRQRNANQIDCTPLPTTPIDTGGHHTWLSQCSIYVHWETIHPFCHVCTCVLSQARRYTNIQNIIIYCIPLSECMYSIVVIYRLCVYYIYRIAGNFGGKIFWRIAENMSFGGIYFGGWASLSHNDIHNKMANQTRWEFNRAVS